MDRFKINKNRLPILRTKLRLSRGDSTAASSRITSTETSTADIDTSDQPISSTAVIPSDSHISESQLSHPRLAKASSSPAIAQSSTHTVDPSQRRSDINESTHSRLKAAMLDSSSQSPAGNHKDSDITPRAGGSSRGLLQSPIQSSKTSFKGKAKSTEGRGESSRGRDLVQMSGLKLSNSVPQRTDYATQSEGGFTIFVKLGQEFRIDAETVSESVYLNQALAFHPAESGAWVKLSSGPSSGQVLKKIFGEALADLPNDYANIRMALGFLFLGAANTTDFRIKAVRPYPKFFAGWKALGTPSPDAPDVIEVDLSVAAEQHFASHMRRNQLQDVWWEAHGDQTVIRPLHPKDLCTQFLKTSPRSDAEFSEADKREIYALSFAHAASPKVSRTASELWGSLKNPEAAHIVHATRGKEFFRAGVIGREFAGKGKIPSQESLGDSTNGLWLPKDLHSAFDSKRLVVIPFPNRGWISSTEVRPPTEDWPGLEPFESEDGMLLPLAQEVLVVSTHGRLYKKTKVEAVCCPTTVRTGANLKSKWDAEGPRAAYLAYAAAARLFGKTDVLHEEMLQWAACFNQPLCPNELLVQDWLETASIATASAASVTDSEGTEAVSDDPDSYHWRDQSKFSADASGSPIVRHTLRDQFGSSWKRPELVSWIRDISETTADFGPDHAA
ncbi:unnamed protein product [Sympodiomycopsis kandeliae]